MEPPKLSYDQEWVIQIRRAIEEGVPISIFSVPKILISLKQEAYIPQLNSPWPIPSPAA
jgi:hypothetical protein